MWPTDDSVCSPSDMATAARGIKTFSVPHVLKASKPFSFLFFSFFSALEATVSTENTTHKVLTHVFQIFIFRYCHIYVYILLKYNVDDT